ncbi:hypothetical protein NLC29_00390 [Candidatus Aminicenantes bacterium AH-873-B07]|jgi:hypothetical protein|nr:hypothetical protein [Candidatus Aminicenantes bacterium AH-873-B07]
MKKLKQFKKKTNKFIYVDVKFKSGDCQCDHDTCETKCYFNCIWYSHNQTAWNKAGDVDAAITAVPPAD